MNILPNLDKIKIPEDKFINYALNPVKSKDKAIAFELALGYNLTNYQLLINDIMSNITEYNATPKGDFGHGELYEIIMKLVGVNGKTANVLTAWIDDLKKGEMRLTNVYIDKKKGGEK